MRRFAAVFLVVVFTQYVVGALVAVPEDNKEDNMVVPAPEEAEGTGSIVQVNAVGVENVSCAQIGEFCMNHSDCCTNACLGYMKRCVSGRELDMQED